MERTTGIEPVLPAWESNLSALYFQYLQNRSTKTYVHALHIVHAMPDCVSLRDGCGTFSIMRCCSRPTYSLVPEASRSSRSVMVNDLRGKTLPCQEFHRSRPAPEMKP